MQVSLSTRLIKAHLYETTLKSLLGMTMVTFYLFGVYKTIVYPTLLGHQ